MASKTWSLEASNILVTGNESLKVADFGMTVFQNDRG
jgi:hypothetical protein